jgi:hypothetical protein
MSGSNPDYRAHIRSQYNSPARVWDPADRWHLWMRKAIEREMDWVAGEFFSECPMGGLVVDVGSGGESYTLGNATRIDVDIAENRLRGCALAVCGNVEYLPLHSGISDLTVCVGPVINYCSLEESISELARVTKIGRRLVLHVELSNGFEYFGTSDYRQDAAFVPTFYREEKLWIYSASYVRRMLGQNHLTIERVRCFHMISSFLLRITGRPNLAALAAPVDLLLSGVPGVAGVADSAIFVCRRSN